MLRLISSFFLIVALSTTLLFGYQPPIDQKPAPPVPPPPPQKVPSPPQKNKPLDKKNLPPLPELPAAIPGEVDIHFFNGSTVRMIIYSETLEIATLYGKLTVPVKDVRSVDFGLHFPEGSAEKIAGAIKNLASNSFQEREDAQKILVELGPFSYPALAEASKERDPEVSRAAQMVIKKLQSKFTKSDLKTSSDDKVVTAKFTIVGRILTPTIKAKTEYFGNVELSLAKMRTLRAVGGPSGDVVVSVDASSYANANQWLDTKFRCDGRSAMSIHAKGIVDVNPQGGGGFFVTPSGFQASRNGRGVALPAGTKLGIINPQNHAGMLIGKIGEDGEPFFIGEHYEGTQEAEGNLFLHIGPSPFGGVSTGTFEVKIVRKN